MSLEEVDNYNDNIENDLGKSKIKRKIRGWCGLCYQFFENGPNTKVCRDHYLKGKCNLIECKKTSSKCVRRFPNTNSENRHTYCLSKEEVAFWDSSCNLNTYLAREQEEKQEKDNIVNNNSLNTKQCYADESLFNLSKSDNIWNNNMLLQSDSRDIIKAKEALFTVINDNPNIKNEDKKIENNFNFNVDFFNHKSNIFTSSGNNTLNNTIYLNDNNSVNPNYNNNDKDHAKYIFNADIKASYGFDEEDEKSIVAGLSNFKFNSTPEKNKEDINFNILSQKDLASDLSVNPNMHKANSDNTIAFSQTQTHQSVFKSTNYAIKDNTSIDDIMEMVHLNSKIPKNSLNKLKAAFKKRGMNNAKIIRLYKNKQQNWNFLYNDFKDVCTQIEGAALTLENLLEEIS